MRTSEEIARDLSNVRLAYVSIVKDADRQRLSIYECAGRDTLETMKRNLTELLREAEGLNTRLYNQAVTVYNAIETVLEEARLDED